VKNYAYWLNLNGDVCPVRTIHILEVISDPQRFSYTLKMIEEIYSKYGEPIGFEGMSRFEIMSDLIRSHGWCRIRYNPKRDAWSVELQTLTENFRVLLKQFFSAPDVVGNSKFATISVTELFATSGMSYIETSIDKLREL